ncbi:MAG TPA: SsrA-binding protein SmpB [Haliangiales bacterium]|nr:SsrA-binding protein SmpB [Haliangiales bacterium]
MKPEERKTLVRNRKARHDYAIEDTLEAGIVLLGSEVKSLREGAASLVDAFAEVRGGELWLLNADISKYPWANQFNHEPRRDRKLLAKRQEIRRLDTKVREKGFTLVPLEIYLKNGRVKVAVALARGRKWVEKRRKKREDDVRREMDRGE